MERIPFIEFAGGRERELPPGYFKALSNFYAPGREHTADRGDRGQYSAVEAAVIRARAQAVCAECQQHISPTIEWALRGTQTFHPSCALRHDTKQRAATTVAVPLPVAEKTIGILTGRAAPMGEWCAIPHQDGHSFMEQFAPFCFDRSIKRQKPILEINHDRVAIPCGLTFVNYQQQHLDFIASIHDSPRGRFLAGLFKRNDITGVSVRFQPVRKRSDPRLPGSDVIEEADLLAIGLCYGQSVPSWYGTHATYVSREL
jgi:hypothetical protein